ncbi:MAG: FixH family protein [Flavobacteriales bacterium]|nr:FixH family protein [Flavobacteriales bacterium]
MKLLFVGVALVGAMLGGCKKDDPTPNPDDNTDGLVLIGSGYTDAGSMLVKLFSADSVYAAYTQFFIEVRDSATNTVIEDGHVSLSPMMNMPGMAHSAPFENPEDEEAVNGLFPCAVVFQMPSEMGWTLEIHIHEHVNGGQGEITFPISVRTPSTPRTHVVTPLNGNNQLIISYVQPALPEIGMNDFEVTLHTKESMMSFPGEDSYTVEMEPLMLAMGHGSPNNVNPSHTSDGHYQGQVNFTMTGLWRINLNIMDGTEVVDSTSYFEVTIQ